MTSSFTIEVVGASGLAGTAAHRISTVSEYKLYPFRFLASILKE
jgi:hypothetical protein